MAEIWFISDHHFGHRNIIRFTDRTGLRRMRHQFADTDEGLSHMNMTMIDRHNRVVGPDDDVYFGGDLGRANLLKDFLPMMNGKKRLIVGNHDKDKSHFYLRHFKWIRSVKDEAHEGFIMSHYPLHPSCLDHKRYLNVHGHVHSSNILLSKNGKDHPQYFNISVENVDYTPVHLDEIITRAKYAKEYAESKR